MTKQLFYIYTANKLNKNQIIQKNNLTQIFVFVLNFDPNSKIPPFLCIKDELNNEILYLKLNCASLRKITVANLQE